MLTLRFIAHILLGGHLPTSSPDVIYVISVPRPSPFPATLLLLCIILNTNQRGKWRRPGNEATLCALQTLVMAVNNDPVPLVVTISIPAVFKLIVYVVSSTKIIKHFSHLNTLFSIQLCKGPKCLLQNVLTLCEHPEFSEATEHMTVVFYNGSGL